MEIPSWLQYSGPLALLVAMPFSWTDGNERHSRPTRQALILRPALARHQRRRRWLYGGIVMGPPRPPEPSMNINGAAAGCMAASMVLVSDIAQDAVQAESAVTLVERGVEPACRAVPSLPGE